MYSISGEVAVETETLRGGCSTSESSPSRTVGPGSVRQEGQVSPRTLPFPLGNSTALDERGEVAPLAPPRNGQLAQGCEAQLSGMFLSQPGSVTPETAALPILHPGKPAPLPDSRVKPYPACRLSGSLSPTQ